MTSADHHTQLGLVEAKLFASTELAVIHVIDASEDIDDAAVRLQALGMDERQAVAILDLPLRARLQTERAKLFDEAQRLRQLLN